MLLLLSLLFSTRVFLAIWHDKRGFSVHPSSYLSAASCWIQDTRPLFLFGAKVRSSWDETGGIYLILSLFRVKRPHIYFFFFSWKSSALDEQSGHFRVRDTWRRMWWEPFNRKQPANSIGVSIHSHSENFKKKRKRKPNGSTVDDNWQRTESAEALGSLTNRGLKRKPDHIAARLFLSFDTYRCAHIAFFSEFLFFFFILQHDRYGSSTKFFQ